MAKATFISEENQAQNGVSVKWYNVTGTEYADEGVYGIYSDGAVVNEENYPIDENPYDLNEVMEACEQCDEA